MSPCCTWKSTCLFLVKAGDLTTVHLSGLSGGPPPFLCSNHSGLLFILVPWACYSLEAFVLSLALPGWLLPISEMSAPQGLPLEMPSPVPRPVAPWQDPVPLSSSLSHLGVSHSQTCLLICTRWQALWRRQAWPAPSCGTPGIQHSGCFPPTPQQASDKHFLNEQSNEDWACRQHTLWMEGALEPSRSS